MKNQRGRRNNDKGVGFEIKAMPESWDFFNSKKGLAYADENASYGTIQMRMTSKVKKNILGIYNSIINFACRTR